MNFKRTELKSGLQRENYGKTVAIKTYVQSKNI